MPCQSASCPPHNETYGRYPEALSSDELARYFHLDDDGRELGATKRRNSNRLGYVLQLDGTLSGHVP